MKRKAKLLSCLTAATVNMVFAAEGPIPGGVPRLDHVFVIMMENHGYSQILTNPNAPYINELANAANMATNYFAIAHPSSTNYLEVAGGSNFGVHTDNYPDWHNGSCITNLASKIVATDNPASPPICPIVGTGTDAATPAIDMTNETTGPPGVNNIDGIQSIPAASNISGKTIADQLAERGRTWKSYQESLPMGSIDMVNYCTRPSLIPSSIFAACRKATNPAAALPTLLVLMGRTAFMPTFVQAVSRPTLSSCRTSATISTDGATLVPSAPSIRTTTALRLG